MVKAINLAVAGGVVAAAAVTEKELTAAATEVEWAVAAAGTGTG